MSKEIRVRGPNGKIYFVPESKLDYVVSKGALVDPQKEPHAISDLESKGAAPHLAKGYVSGVLGSIPDLASSIYNIPASAMNIMREHARKYPEVSYGPASEMFPVSPNQAELPMIPSATESIEKGLSNVVGETPQEYKNIVEGAKVAGALTTPGGAAKTALKLGATGASKVLGYLGSLKPSVLTGGALAGTTMSKMEEEGYSPLAQIGAGIATGSLPSAAGALSKGTAELGRKAVRGTLGLSPKQLNLKAAKAAQESGVDLPASAFTENKLMNLVDQYMGKSPIFGDKLRKRYIKSEQQTLDRLNSIYDEVGPVKTGDIESQLRESYKKVSSLPGTVYTPATHTMNTIDEILDKLGRSYSPSEDQSYVINKLKEIKEGILKDSNQNIPNIPKNLTKEEMKWLKKNGFEDLSNLGKVKNEAPVMNLWEQKKSLNDSINWNIQDNGYKDILRKVQHSILDDIREYGNKDKDWYNLFKTTDELFGKVAKRERLEYLLSEKPINPSTGTYSYNSLSKIIHTPKTAREIKDITSPETFQKIEKLGEVARTMSIKNRNIPNPSGTAIVSGITGFLGGLYKFSLQTIIEALGVTGLSRVLNDKKFLDLAIKNAEGTKSSKDILNLRRRVKQLTGLSINSINRKMAMEENKER